MWDIVLPPPQDPHKCFHPPKSVIGIILGLAIVFGQFIAFAPQLYSIIRKKHVEGINLLTYLLGTVSCTAVFLSGVIESWNNLFCCSVIVRRIFKSDSRYFVRNDQFLTPINLFSS